MRTLHAKRVGVMDRIASLLIAIVLGAVTGATAVPLRISAAEPQFGPPLGAHDGVAYAPRVTKLDGKIIEDTDYDVQNPDMVGMTCFGVTWEKLWHAGQDLYREDGQSTAGAEVTAVADGTVVYANPHLNYPGLVVIISHDAGGETQYSVYAHIDDNSLEVSKGDSVKRGQKLGVVLKQRYSGRFPAEHPSGDDSHLHFEVRRFLDGSEIYPNAPSCNGLIAGRGYTYPEHPASVPSKDSGYLDPTAVVSD